MSNNPRAAARQTWHSDDFLVRLTADDVSDFSSDDGWVASTSSADPNFGVATLSLIFRDPDRQEHLAALRDTSIADRDLVVFGARTRSEWALDVLAGRYTNHAHDWASLRAAILNAIPEQIGNDPILGALSLERLADLHDLLHERELDDEAGRALLTLITAGLLAGRSLHEQRLEPHVERLLQAGLQAEARVLLPRLRKSTWVRHAITMELSHPRSGGTYDAMLRLMNEPYHRVGLEPISLLDDSSTPFDRLAAQTAAAEAGPLVTVIMTCSNPGPELFTAVRSVIAQSYQHWELLLIDDGSPRGIASTLKKIAALDPRIRTIRNTSAAGKFVRTNEALDLAQGEFVTMHEAHAWAHPRRLEIQVQHLLANPGQLANVVNTVGVDEELSFVGRPGSAMFVAEASLMFRRQEVLKSVGYFDSVKAGADREFRKRLQRSTGVTVPVLLAGAPLIFTLEHERIPSERQNGISLWNRPERDFYWSGVRRFRQRIEADEASPLVKFPQADRPFSSPRLWSIESQEPQSFDLLVVLDGREFSKLREFHATVVGELETAVAAGLRVAVLHSLSLPGPRGKAYFAPALQDLIDSGDVTRITESDEVEAAVVVVRHAGAAQGHLAERRQVTAHKVVVVEDRLARDVRGRSYARADVSQTVSSWFGVAPLWVAAAPTLPAGTVSRVAFDGKRVALTISSSAPKAIRDAHLIAGNDSVALEPTTFGNDYAVFKADSAAVQGQEWMVRVSYDAGGGRTVNHVYPLTLNTLIINDPHHVGLRTEDGGLLVLPNAPGGGLPGLSDFVDDFLSAPVTHITVVDDGLQVTLKQAQAASVSRVYALRIVDDSVARRRDFAVGRSATGDVVWERPLTKFADSRWRIYASFRTPLGLVEYPVHTDQNIQTDGSATWVPRVLSGGRVIVAPPQPGRVARAVRRVRRAAESRVDGVGRLLKARTAVTSEAETIRFDSSHAEPRGTTTPTVSVVMPVYNVEPYLDVAISSVLNQEFADIELILIDDASTDDGRRIIRKYWQSDPRVRVFALDHNTIGGAGVPSNIGIRGARGEYIAFADSDDHVTAHGLARLVSLAETHEADLVVGDFKTFSEKIQEGTQSYDHAVWGELPLNTPISALNYPALFRLSPVPWRKLYRRSFLLKHDIEYPEGDYFYEDNPLHWFVLSRANSVVMCDEVISFHRMDREGQTMSAASYKLGAFVNHMNTILGYLATSTSKNRDALFEAFFNYLARTNWVANNQTQESAKGLIRHGMNSIFQRARLAAPDAKVAPELRARLASYGEAYPDTDLTIVIPVFNSADLLQQTVDSVLAVSGIRINVILVDDGSTDASLRIMEEYENANDNVHVFAQGNRGAGRARNSVIPLCTGRYTFFLDADDVIDPEALVAAVKQADSDAADLLFFKYRLEFTDEGRREKMPNSDRDIWRKLRGSVRHTERQKLVARLINYPWNRIIRTSLLHDANIFFGATIVNNDVLYHWHSVVSAQKISTLDVVVCTHRKFATRDQVTNIQDERRMAVLEAIRSTHERIATLDAYPNVRAEWEGFATHLLDWAKSRVPESLHPIYDARRAELIRTIGSD